MSAHLRAVVLTVSVLLGACSAALSEPSNAPGVLRLLPADSVTEKTITLAGRPLAYTATAGTLALYDQSGEKSAAIFYTAYVAKERVPNRPVTFAFNGGPGAASAYLHLGLAGPRIVDFGPQGNDGAAAKLVDNPDSWLAFTDLVFIDPISAGWSRTAKPDAASGYHGVRRDAEVMAKAIALYVAQNSRSAAPKYLLGESYGGFRAAKVARALQSDQGIVATGIVMVSPMLETRMQWAGASNALGAALHFPSIAAAELDRTKSYTPQKMAEIERFAIHEYLPALAGPRPAGDEAKTFYGRLAQLTGLPYETVVRTRGYIRESYLEQLRGQGRVASWYDGAHLAPDPYPENRSRRGGDPVLDGFTRALAGAFAGYARDELGYKTEMTYVLLADGVAGKWDWGERRAPPGVSDDIRNLLALDPSFRLLVAHGRSDLVTPHGVTRYVLDNIPPIGAPGRVELKLYRGGHMFYFDGEARRAFTKEAAEFFGRGW
jgi:carboxypeptidase C (cathepsin A)